MPTTPRAVRVAASAAFIAILTPNSAPSEPIREGATLTGTARAIDGDTLALTVGAAQIRIRLAAINAPETYDRPWGPRATAALTTAIAGARITCRFSGETSYERQVAVCWRGDSQTIGPLIGAALIRQGLAVAYPQFLPAHPAPNQLIEAEQAARSARIGLWSE